MATKIAVKSKKDVNADDYCPICGEGAGKCYKLWDSGEEDDKEVGYFCSGEIQGNDNYWKGVPCKNDFWNFWRKKKAGESQADYEARRAARAAQRLKERQERARRMLPVPRRDEWFGRLLGSLKLSPNDRSDLQRRGLSDAEIEVGRFRSISQYQPLPLRFPPNLPGVDPISQSKLLNGGDGYLIPVVNVNQLIVGCQLRLSHPNSGGRYRWLSSSYQEINGGQGHHTPNGETPLTVRRPIGDHDPSIVGFCEGLGVKPFIVAVKRNQIVVGTSGASWTASPETLKGSLKILNASRFELYPDAGMVLNSSILGGYHSLLKALEEMNKPITVAWWGQSHKIDGDIDEIPIDVIPERLSVKDFWCQVLKEAEPIYLALAESIGEKPVKGSPIDIANHYSAIKKERRVRRLTLVISRQLSQRSLSWGDPRILGWMERNRVSQESFTKSVGLLEAFYRFISLEKISG